MAGWEEWWGVKGVVPTQSVGQCQGSAWKGAVGHPHCHVLSLMGMRIYSINPDDLQWVNSVAFNGLL